MFIPCSARTSMGLARLTNIGRCELVTFRCGADQNHESSLRTPSWTDRVLYATYTDDPETPEGSNITNLLYTSVPGYTTSDHVNPSPAFRSSICLTPALMYRNPLSRCFFSHPPPLPSIPEGFRFLSFLRASNPSPSHTPL